MSKSITFQELCFPYHTHAEIVFAQDSEQIVYREADVLRLLETVRVLTIKECANKARTSLYIPDDGNGPDYTDMTEIVDKQSILSLPKDTIEV